MDNTLFQNVDFRKKVLQYYDEPNTLRVTGKKFGISHEWVRQILIEDAPDRIRKPGVRLLPETQEDALNRARKNRRTRALSKDLKSWTNEETRFLFKNYGRLSQNEIAKTLGKNRGAVASRRFRMLKMLFQENDVCDDGWNNDELRTLLELFSIDPTEKISLAVNKPTDEVIKKWQWVIHFFRD